MHDDPGPCDGRRLSSYPELVPEPAIRDSARVVVVDETGSVLLCRIDIPFDTKPPVWITPGGGIEQDEPVAVAAARELHEETGVAVAPSDLGSPVAVCRGDWTFRGIPLRSADWFFALRTQRFEPVDDGLTDLERETHGCWQWWLPEDVETSTEVVLPAGLAGLVRRIAAGERWRTPVELPWLTA